MYHWTSFLYSCNILALSPQLYYYAQWLHIDTGSIQSGLAGHNTVGQKSISWTFICYAMPFPLSMQASKTLWVGWLSSYHLRFMQLASNWFLHIRSGISHVSTWRAHGAVFIAPRQITALTAHILLLIHTLDNHNPSILLSIDYFHTTSETYISWFPYLWRK